MHSSVLELTKLTYTRLEDNLIRHRGDRMMYLISRSRRRSQGPRSVSIASYSFEYRMQAYASVGNPKARLDDADATHV